MYIGGGWGACRQVGGPGGDGCGWWDVLGWGAQKGGWVHGGVEVGNGVELVEGEVRGRGVRCISVGGG